MQTFTVKYVHGGRDLVVEAESHLEAITKIATDSCGEKYIKEHGVYFAEVPEGLQHFEVIGETESKYYREQRTN